MFKFKAEQKIFDIGGVKFGGQPGEVPTVLIGSMFYFGQKNIDLDERIGSFNKEKAEDIIKEQETLSDITGNPGLVEVVGATDEAMMNQVDFVADVTDLPFMISSEVPSALIAGTKHVAEIGVQNRVIYNSIPTGGAHALKAIKDSQVDAAVLLARNPQKETSEGKVEIVERIMKLADRAEVGKPIIDVASFAFGVKMGAAARAIYDIKNVYGYPVGIGSGNVTTTCDWARTKFDKDVRRTTISAINVIPQIMGADWLLYGPIHHAKWVFPSAAIADSYVLTAAAELGVKPLIDGVHPLFNILRG